MTRLRATTAYLVLAATLASAPPSLRAQTRDPAPGEPSEAEVIVEVVDHLGLPVPNAEVYASSSEPQLSADCVTESHGSCSLGLLPLPTELYLGVGHREYEYYSEWLDLASSGPHVLVRLPEPPWRLLPGSGRILDQNGEPVEGATITLTEMMEHIADEWTTVTDAEGAFAVERLPEGAYYVTVEAEGFATTIASMWVGSEALPLEVELAPGTAVRGTITALLKTGCQSAEVFAWQESERSDDCTITITFRGPGPIRAEGQVNERCEYEFPHLGPGLWRLGVLDDDDPIDLLARWLEVSVGQREVIFDLEPGERECEAVEVEPSTATGSVTDRTTGKGLEGAQVLVGWWDGNSRGGHARPHSTGPGGEFTFPASRNPSLSVYLIASSDGYTTESVPWDGSAEPVSIELSPTKGLSYRVRWFDGVDPDLIGLALIDDAGRRIETGWWGWATGSEGRWSSAPEGEFVLEVTGAYFSLRVPVVITAGAPVDIVIPPSGGAKLRVPELEAEFGNGWLDGVTVEARPLGELEGTPAVRDEEALYLEGLAPGPWEITMTAPDGRTWTGRAEIQLRETTVVFLR